MRHKFEMIWRNKWLTADAKCIDDMIAAYRETLDLFIEMREAEVKLDPESGVRDDYASLVTDAPAVAEKFGLEPPFDDEDDWEECDDSQDGDAAVGV